MCLLSSSSSLCAGALTRDLPHPTVLVCCVATHLFVSFLAQCALHWGWRAGSDVDALCASPRAPLARELRAAALAPASPPFPVASSSPPAQCPGVVRADPTRSSSSLSAVAQAQMSPSPTSHPLTSVTRSSASAPSASAQHIPRCFAWITPELSSPSHALHTGVHHHDSHHLSNRHTDSAYHATPSHHHRRPTLTVFGLRCVLHSLAHLLSLPPCHPPHRSSPLPLLPACVPCDWVSVDCLTRITLSLLYSTCELIAKPLLPPASDLPSSPTLLCALFP